MSNLVNSVGSFLEANSYVLVALSIWELVWKGLALWKSARNNNRNWFLAILVFNTVGLLSIIYLKFFQKKNL